MPTYAYDTANTVYDTATYDTFVVGAPTVELFLNSVWVDVTAYVRVDDGIRIQRGRQDEQAQPQPATCRLTLDNADGRFTPRYTSGAYYPYLVRNTQLRVSVRLDDGSTAIRFWGNVPSWPLSFDLTGRDFTVQVEAAGARRLLTVGAIPLKSPYTLAVAGLSNVLGYWPMEDESGSTMIASTVAGTTALEANADFAADSGFACSLPLPTWDAATASGRFVVPVATAGASGQQVRFLFRAGGTTAGAWVAQIDTSGAHYFWWTINANTGAHQFLMFNYATAALEYTGTGHAFAAGVDLTQGLRMSFEVKQNGTGVDVGLHYARPDDGSAYGSAPETIASTTLGTVTGVRWFSPTQLPDGTPLTGVPDASTFGQLTIENNITLITDLGAALTAYNGESASDRWVRLCTALNIPASINTGLGSSALGPQGELTPLQILDEAASADDGLSTEVVGGYGLKFRVRSDMYTTIPAPQLSVSHMNSAVPIDDDQTLVNDVTVSRPGGSSARAVATSGLTPALVGTYADSVDLNLYLDSQLADQAGWRMNVGSVDLSRWQIGFDLLQFSSYDRAAMVAAREGDIFAMTGLSTQFGGTSGGTIMRLLGWTETITVATWDFEINAGPGRPWSEVLLLDDSTFGRLDTNRLGM